MSKASWEDTPPVRRLIARILKLAEPIPGFARGPIPGGYDQGYVGPLGEYIGYYRNDPDGGDTYPYCELDIGAGPTSNALAFLAAEDDHPGRDAYLGLGAGDDDQTNTAFCNLTAMQDTGRAGVSMRMGAASELVFDRIPAVLEATLTHVSAQASQLGLNVDAVDVRVRVGSRQSVGPQIQVTGDAPMLRVSTNSDAGRHPAVVVAATSGGASPNALSDAHVATIWSTGDIEIHNSAVGVILTDSAGGKHRIKVATNGTLSTEVVT